MELERDDIKKSLRGNKLSKLDRESVVNLRKEIQDKLNIVGKIYGVNLELGRIKFDDIGFRASLSAQLDSLENKSTGEQMSGEQAAFERMAWRLGLDKKLYNAEVMFSNGRHKGLKGNIVGINRRAKKYPIVIRLQDGKGNFRTSVKGIRDLLGIPTS